MADDIELGSEKQEDVEFVFPTPHDDIAAAHNALQAISDVDDKIQTSEAAQRRIRRIRRNAYIIIDKQLQYLVDCLEEDKEEE